MNNRLTSNTYDFAGNQTNDGLHNYAFNAENQITQMDGGAAVYAYDGEGRRMKKTVGSETTFYFYAPSGIISEFTTTAGTTQASASDRTTYRTSDKLGSAVLIMNGSGAVVENNRTLPYGEAWCPETSSTNDKKFTTYQRDQESGLDYAMARYYANRFGRMTSVDKGRHFLGDPRTLNRFAYANNDPVNIIDPDGNEGTTVEWGCSLMMEVNPAWVCDPFGGRPGSLVEEVVFEWTMPQKQAQADIRNAARNGQRLFDAFNRALQKLENPDCAALFNTSGTGVDPKTVLSDLYLGTSRSTPGKYGYIDFDRRGRTNGVLDNAETTNQFSTHIDNIGREVVNTSAPMIAHISINLTAGTTLYQGSNALANTLLHELGHVYHLQGLGGTKIKPDSRINPAASTANSDEIRKACDN